LRGFNALGSRYDDAAAAAALDVLRAWKLRGSLMLSCDFESAQGVPGKFSIYAYLGPGGLARVAEAVGVEPCGRLPVAVAFWALDLCPDGRFALKFYEKAPYAPASVPSALRTQAGRLHLLAPIRDVTRLTRIGSAANGADKVYVGFQDGLELADLSRAGIFPRHADLINDLRDRAPEQKTYFIGFSGSELELYFDRRDMPSHAYSPATNGRLDPGRHISTRQEARR
ncbi:MAG TPA: hypothetical protein VNI01_01245, partial [Elusimicrobiota bacterium]|nr:hypothetical protein [Elusimicrobiota bacterium]